MVIVNGVPAPLTGTSFVAPSVPLIEGGNTLTATALSALGHVGTASINVVRDLTPPRVSTSYPIDHAAIFDPAISVSGLVNDIVAGTVNAAQVSVTVNGLAATVANRAFVVDSVPLTPGSNTVTAVAVDQSGNVGRATVTVQLVASAGVPRLTVASGNRQQAVIGTALPQPLVVQLRSAAGTPVAGQAAAFQVRGNDGHLGTSGGVAVATTDGSGLAAMTFTLGTHTGPAAQVVTVTATGFAGPAVFTADALPGPPAVLVVDSGDQQVGVAGQQLPRPLVAVVTDAGYNRLAGVTFSFKVAKGQGHFINGLTTLSAVSDTDGRLIVAVVLDPTEGIANHVVEARIAGLSTSPAAVFVASGRAAGPAAATSVSGVVLDNTSAPIAGVTLRILGTSLLAQSDPQGQFHIAGAPVGAIILVVDGSTADRPGSWPDLEYSLTTIAGRDNTPNMPIYLLPLDLQHGLMVDETHGGTLTLPAMPGFAPQIAPGSVTFPGGGRNGIVSVTVVHNDKVPMVPNFGQQPRFIVTIQPAGARFDPPARLTLPNLEGLPQGQVTEMYSFDHDMGHFVSIGPATVSDDGSVITSNPGVGVIKAGWHCGGNPARFGTPDKCLQCQVCDGDGCVPGCFGCGCDDGNPCTVTDICLLGFCQGTPLLPGTATAEADGKPTKDVVAIGSPVNFSAMVNLPNCPTAPAYNWDLGDGTMSTASAFAHTYTQKGTYNVTLQITCPPCPSVLAQSAVTVYVVALDHLTVKSGASQQGIIGAKNWATLKKAGAAVIQAILDPDVEGAADLIRWSGATPDSFDKHFANISTSQSAKQTVKAKVGTSSDELTIWIMWVMLELRASGVMSSTDTLTNPAGFTFPKLGPQTAEHDGLDPVAVGLGDGQVEIIGHVAPAGVNTIFDEIPSWGFSQTKTAAGCSNGQPVQPAKGEPDGPESDHETHSPTTDDQIYYIDAPSVGHAGVFHTAEHYLGLKVVATWNSAVASDNFFWNYNAAADADLPANKVQLNVIGQGPGVFPNGCRYEVRK